MPAVIIRMMDALSSITEQTTSDVQRRILVRQAEMIYQSAEESVPDSNDRQDIRIRYERLLEKTVLDEAKDTRGAS
jgi:uncharacterized membrane protein